ncbi:hypothetical protein L6164_018974 [Bauhinia variegata]|uniref:Uncharacterized protein n=1 Tax=Bauhinia variegata TaxID=167791 RepID=A0ACB9NEW6_BAUVA|nr:hypothetical protein L6164_018974 [Bauhinia variegata]
MAISARHQLLMELHTLLSQSHTTEYIKGQWPWNLSKHVCAVLALDHNVQHDVLVTIAFPALPFYGQRFCMTVHQAK